MNLIIKIASRYLIGKKSHNIVNLVSLVSIAGVFTGTMALIVVLSVFNGFGNLVISLYDTFDPDIKITAVKGKTFNTDAINLETINAIDGIQYAAFTIEENCLARYGEKQDIVTLKGMDNELMKKNGLSKAVITGLPILKSGERNFAIIGSGVAYALSVNMNTTNEPLMLYLPDKNFTSPSDVENSLRQMNIPIGGIFAIQQDFDSKYILAPRSFVQEFIDAEGKASAIEIMLKPGVDETAIIQKIKVITGNDFSVKNRVQQHEFLYKILSSEKWAVFLILSFIMVIGIFNILGTLTMLVIEKKKDIIILKNLGAGFTMVKKIFFMEGILITLVGVVGGLFAGGIICFMQQHFHLIKLGNADSFVVEAYPVQMQVTDFISVFLVVFCIGALASYFIATHLVKKQYSETGKR